MSEAILLLIKHIHLLTWIYDQIPFFFLNRNLMELCKHGKQN